MRSGKRLKNLATSEASDEQPKLKLSNRSMVNEQEIHSKS